MRPALILLLLSTPAAAQLGPLKSPDPAARPQALPAVSYPTAIGGRHQATTARARDGHFWFDGAVNGQPTRLLFDTGATRTGIRHEDAARLGLDPGALAFTIKVQTGNGTTEVAPVTIDRLTIGDITARDVPAFVARPGVLPVNLLGQSFMARLKEYKFLGENPPPHRRLTPTRFNTALT